VKIGVNRDRTFEQCMILAPFDVDCAKLLQMIGCELSVEETKAADP